MDEEKQKDVRGHCTDCGKDVEESFKHAHEFQGHIINTARYGPKLSYLETAELMDKVRLTVGEMVMDSNAHKELRKYVRFSDNAIFDFDFPGLFRERPDLLETIRKRENR